MRDWIGPIGRFPPPLSHAEVDASEQAVHDAAIRARRPWIVEREGSCDLLCLRQVAENKRGRECQQQNANRLGHRHNLPRVNLAIDSLDCPLTWVAGEESVLRLVAKVKQNFASCRPLDGRDPDPGQSLPIYLGDADTPRPLLN